MKNKFLVLEFGLNFLVKTESVKFVEQQPPLPAIETIQYKKIKNKDPEQTQADMLAGGVIVKCGGDKFFISMKTVDDKAITEAKIKTDKVYKKGSKGWKVLNKIYKSITY